MPITVNTNVSALIAQNNLIGANTSLNKVLQQLSTGLRINSAADDAAGLAISVGMENQIKGNERAATNIQDGLSLMQTAEGGMNIVNEHLSRVRELCVQAANEIYNTQNKISILNEMKQRISDIDIQAQSINFNNIPLLDGTKEHLFLQFGAGTDPALNSIDIGPTLTNMRIDDTGLNVELKVTTGPATGDYVNIADWDPTEIMGYMDQIDVAVNKITTDRSMLGAYSNRLEANKSNLTSLNENTEESKSRIMDVDLVKASTEMIKYQILQQSTTSVLGQANQVPQLALQLLK
ncbi:MAG: flagellin [Candidatus Gastranaerophilales bacterium]|nr:flagellin [Candidatus Gastranaerophilales bacterium]